MHANKWWEWLSLFFPVKRYQVFDLRFLACENLIPGFA